jgi:signal transduction histidine kinase
MTRLDSGLMRSEPEQVSIAGLLTDLAHTYAPLAEAQQLSLTLSCPPSHCRIYGFRRINVCELS